MIKKIKIVEIGAYPSRCKWLYKCDCGKRFILRADSKRKHCGCRNKNKKHGFSNNPLYFSWKNMIDRCYNKKSKMYKYYGGRGIKVSKRWLNLDNYIKDLGEKPFKNASVDRINNGGNYSKKNCKWSTKLEQSRNRRNTKLYKGKSFSQIGKDLGGSNKVVFDRIKKGWDLHKACTTPISIQHQISGRH